MRIFFRSNVPLKPYNTFGISANASIWVRLNHLEQLPTLTKKLANLKKPFFYLGQGSNTIFNDGNIKSVIIKNELKGIHLYQENAQKIIVEVLSGENWHNWVRFALKNSWYGLENLSFIPGTVGAAPVQNIGAYGIEVGSLIHSIVCIDLSAPSGKFITLSAKECAFGYRESFFKSHAGKKLFIVAVRFLLSKIPQVITHYDSIEKELQKMGLTQSLITPEALAKAVIALRRRTLPDPKKMGNVGSFFKNPIVDVQSAKKLLKAHPKMPTHALSKNHIKIPAGWLIDQANLRGYAIGNAQVNQGHALVLTNMGAATCSDVKSLARHIQKVIQIRYGITLIPEPVFVE